MLSNTCEFPSSLVIDDLALQLNVFFDENPLELMQFKVFLGAPVIGSFSADFWLSFTSMLIKHLSSSSESLFGSSQLTSASMLWLGLFLMILRYRFAVSSVLFRE